MRISCGLVDYKGFSNIIIRQKWPLHNILRPSGVILMSESNKIQIMMKATFKAKQSNRLNLAKMLQNLTMLFESPEKKQFRRLKDFITG